MNTLLHLLTKNRYINIAIKTFVVILLCWVLYRQVFAKENIDQIWDTFVNNLTFDKIHWLSLTILLIPVNWGFESLKWQALIRNFESLSFGKTFQAILTGITFSLFTPNRVGEYGGRILLVQPENNWKAVIATLVGSFSQLLILLSFGIVGLLYFTHYFLQMEPWMWNGILLIGLFLVGLMLFCFYNIDLVVPIARRIPFAHRLKRFVRHVRVLENYSSKTLSIVLCLSLARYVTYSFQYFFMLQFFGIDVSLLEGLAGIATIFLLQTSIPLPPIWGVFVRGKIALDIWGIFSQNDMGILASTFSIWILNLIIPALIGTVFIIKINVVQSLLGPFEKPKKPVKKEEATYFSSKT